MALIGKVSRYQSARTSTWIQRHPQWQRGPNCARSYCRPHRYRRCFRRPSAKAKEHAPQVRVHACIEYHDLFRPTGRGDSLDTWKCPMFPAIVLFFFFVMWSIATMLKTPVEETQMRSLGGNLETFHARLQCADGMTFQHELASIRTKSICTNRAHSQIIRQ